MPPKVATRSSLEQIAILDVLLSRQKPTSMTALTCSLDCCEKTVRRHMNWMRKKLKVRIIRTADGWRYAGGQPCIFSRHARSVIGW
jgi:predicted ArsR family transcriptional regulator